ncbi:MAG: hypothetical protein EAZ92_02660 [Candidatus Kapaibacterium sp.]|nr:MAG: hypothetical protein EAZ92_02660 [Candidatus Kapabacteria bacterium]
MFAFGVYMLGQGIILFFIPNLLLGMVGLPLANEVWVRVLGIAVTVLGFFYIMAARADFAPFFRWTLVSRTFQLVAFAGLVATGLASPIVLAFAGIEFLSGVWTFFALRQSSAA